MGETSGRWAKRNARLQAAKEFIEVNLQWSGLSPASTARAIGISPRLLHMLFEPTGTTFSRYVLAQRLERARQELANPGRKVLDVAYSCCLENSTFYRAFRNAYGTTPRAYRQSVLQQPQPQNGDSVASAGMLLSGEAAHDDALMQGQARS